MSENLAAEAFYSQQEYFTNTSPVNRSGSDADADALEPTADSTTSQLFALINQLNEPPIGKNAAQQPQQHNESSSNLINRNQISHGNGSDELGSERLSSQVRAPHHTNNTNASSPVASESTETTINNHKTGQMNDSNSNSNSISGINCRNTKILAEQSKNIPPLCGETSSLSLSAAFQSRSISGNTENLETNNGTDESTRSSSSLLKGSAATASSFSALSLSSSSASSLLHQHHHRCSDENQRSSNSQSTVGSNMGQLGHDETSKQITQPTANSNKSKSKSTTRIPRIPALHNKQQQQLLSNSVTETFINLVPETATTTATTATTTIGFERPSAEKNERTPPPTTTKSITSVTAHDGPPMLSLADDQHHQHQHQHQHHQQRMTRSTSKSTGVNSATASSAIASAAAAASNNGINNKCNSTTRESAAGSNFGFSGGGGSGGGGNSGVCKRGVSVSGASISKALRSLSIDTENNQDGRDNDTESVYNLDGTRTVRYIVRHRPKESQVKIFSKKLTLKNVSSKIGSLEKASYTPGGGNIVIENKQLNWNAQSKIRSLEKAATYVPSGGNVKIESHKLSWNAQSKIGSLDKASYTPGGGNVKIESRRLTFKEKARPRTDTGLIVVELEAVATASQQSANNSDTNSNVASNGNSQSTSSERLNLF